MLGANHVAGRELPEARHDIGLPLVQLGELPPRPVPRDHLPEKLGDGIAQYDQSLLHTIHPTLFILRFECKTKYKTRIQSE